MQGSREVRGVGQVKIGRSMSRLFPFHVYPFRRTFPKLSTGCLTLGTLAGTAYPFQLLSSYASQSEVGAGPRGFALSALGPVLNRLAFKLLAHSRADASGPGGSLAFLTLHTCLLSGKQKVRDWGEGGVQRTLRLEPPFSPGVFFL